MNNPVDLTDHSSLLNSYPTSTPSLQPQLEVTIENLATPSGVRQDHAKPYRITIKGDLANDTGTRVE